MGLETALLIGFAAAKSYAEVSAAKKEAKGVVAQAEQEANAKAKAVRQKASQAKVSFLNSGLTLEGTPELSIQGILEAGQQDIGQLAANANTKAKTLIGNARTKAILNIGQAGLTAGMGGMGSSSVIQSTNVPGVATPGGWSSTPYSGTDITWRT